MKLRVATQLKSRFSTHCNLEADEGIPTTRHCGAEPVVETSDTPVDPGVRYFS
uniref:Uncharacterized protein n=1 Tax=Brassica oleracea TaxID=3712 RepID=A0A3P6BFM5_BRAOL|nr:unnamed protein product [Brassica oleracea]